MKKEHHTNLPNPAACLLAAFNPEEVPAAAVLCPDLCVGWAEIAHSTAVVTGTINVT